MLDVLRSGEYQSVWQVLILILVASNKIYLLFGMFISHEASLIATGIGYRAKYEKQPEDFNTLRSMDITKFTFSSSCKDSIAGWNMRT